MASCFASMLSGYRRYAILFAVSLLAALAWAAPTLARERVPLVGILFDDRLTSGIVNRTLPYRVYLPPDYASTYHRYPVLYMLHGAGGNYTEWDDSSLPDVADRLMAQGEIQSYIVVMPDGGNRTYWANWADSSARWEDYVVNEVVPEIDRRYRTIQDPSARAIGGLSAGGLGALNIAMHHPDVFGVVGGHSPSIRLEPDPALWFLSGDAFWVNDPVWLARNRAGVARLLIWLDVGEEDWWRPNIEVLRDTLADQSIPYTWHVFPGTHEADYWIAHVPDYLRFYAGALRGDPSSASAPLTRELVAF